MEFAFEDMHREVEEKKRARAASVAAATLVGAALTAIFIRKRRRARLQS